LSSLEQLVVPYEQKVVISSSAEPLVVPERSHQSKETLRRKFLSPRELIFPFQKYCSARRKEEKKMMDSTIPQNS
jgi:hypothetical protein